jgi:hypothetical protein
MDQSRAAVDNGKLSGRDSVNELSGIIGVLVYEFHLSRDNPDALFEMPIRRLLYWYEMALKLRELKQPKTTKVSAEQLRAQAQARAQLQSGWGPQPNQPRRGLSRVPISELQNLKNQKK